MTRLKIQLLWTALKKAIRHPRVAMQIFSGLIAVFKIYKKAKPK